MQMCTQFIVAGFSHHEGIEEVHIESRVFSDWRPYYSISWRKNRAELWRAAARCIRFIHLSTGNCDRTPEM